MPGSVLESTGGSILASAEAFADGQTLRLLDPGSRTDQLRLRSSLGTALRGVRTIEGEPVRYRAPLGPARKPTWRLFWRPGFASPEERRAGAFYSNSTVAASICNVVASSFIRRVRSSFNCWAENAGSASRKVACFSINRDAKSAQVSGKTPMVR